MTKILIVDDDDGLALLLRTLYGKSRFDARLASNAFAALKMILEAYLEDDPFDALIFDCALPRMDGFTISQTVRLWESKMDRPHVMRLAAFTAFSEDVEKSTLLQRDGVEMYFRKPDVPTPKSVAKWLGIEAEG
jgi:DNA-binding response OmpR family regulator